MSSDAPKYGDPQTRARILDVTQQLIAARGSNLTLSEVADAAAVSRQALYLHFGDRTGLLVALVNHMDSTLELGPALDHDIRPAAGHIQLELAV